MKLQTHMVEKPWGRRNLPLPFGSTPGKAIGEVWFESPPNAALLAKYIFTSEKLSVQNHPSDEEAQARGLKRGKEECWYILGAEPGATLGLGLKSEISKAELRQIVLDGSIEQLMHWRPVRPGDFFYVPAGTIHAIGAGISLVEFQQNSDVTYRLYDYGRPRELHLQDGIAVAKAERYPESFCTHVLSEEARVLVDGPHFQLVQGQGSDIPLDGLSDRRRWILPLGGRARAGRDEAQSGECLLLEPREQVEIEGGPVLIGAEAVVPVVEKPFYPD